MKQQETTDSVRIDSTLLEKVRQIAKSKGQTIAGYINVNLSKQVDRDWVKFNKIKNGFQPSQD